MEIDYPQEVSLLYVLYTYHMRDLIVRHGYGRSVCPRKLVASLGGVEGVKDFLEELKAQKKLVPASHEWHHKYSAAYLKLWHAMRLENESHSPSLKAVASALWKRDWRTAAYQLDPSRERAARLGLQLGELANELRFVLWEPNKLPVVKSDGPQWSEYDLSHNIVMLIG